MDVAAVVTYTAPHWNQIWANEAHTHTPGETRGTHLIFIDVSHSHSRKFIPHLFFIRCAVEICMIPCEKTE